ncbi:MAG: hypothetical protein P8J45_00860 [Phycisphaerales bacterium]|nr:hypothetical protein [Phycisphaerales bacterium]
MCIDFIGRRLFLPTLGVLAGTLLLAMASSQDSGSETARSCKQKMLKVQDMVGSSDLKMQVDMAAVGQPGVVFDLTGTGDSMFVLDGTGWLNVSEVDRTQSVDYMGYRSDLNQYFLVNMSPDRTALSYMAGDFVSNDVMKLTDPMSQVTAEMAIGKKGTKTTVRVPPNQATFMSMENTPSARKTGDVLKTLMSGPIRPASVNRKADNPNPADNYNRAHRLLQKFSGDFSTNDGFKVSSRMVAEGRYLLSHVTAPSEFLGFMSYSSAGGFFQQMLVGPDLAAPIYIQGPLQADGSILMSDPFNPNGMEVLITFEANGAYSTRTTMGDQVVEQRTWKPDP